MSSRRRPRSASVSVASSGRSGSSRTPNVAATWRATSQSAVTVAARYSGREYNTLANTDTNPNTYGGTSTYTVVDAKFTFRPTKRTELGIGVDNLFDHRYYVFHPYAGRTVYVEGRIGI